MLKKLDSLRPSWRPAGGLNDLSQEQRDQLVSLRAAQIAVIDSLSPTFAKARDQVMSVLRSEQKERAAKFEKNARKRAEESAKRELESSPQPYERPAGRRGMIRDATGHTPLG